MNKELMETVSNAIDWLANDRMQELLGERDKVLYFEKSFGRSLTEEEKKLVLNDGREALFNKIGLDEDDFNTMLRAIALISAGFTESADRYDYELEQNNYKALDLFKSLVNDLECVEAEKHKVRIGNKKDLGSHIKVTGEDCGYKEENDKDLNELFKDSEKSENPNKTFTVDETYEDSNINKIFASETKCDAMHITGDTYDEEKDPDVFNSCEKPGISPIDKAIERLDKGCELELDENTIDKIVDKLWKERDNVSIKIHNNKISLQ